MGDIQAIEPYCIPSLRFFCDKGNFLRESIKLKYPEFGFSGLEYINLDNQGNIPYAKNKKKSYNYNFVKFCAWHLYSLTPITKAHFDQSSFFTQTLNRKGKGKKKQSLKLLLQKLFYTQNSIRNIGDLESLNELLLLSVD